MAVDLDEIYTMFHTVVVDQNGREKTYISQVGGGFMNAEQLGEHFYRVNAYPGAKAVTIHPANTILPAKTIEKNIERLKKAGIRGRPLTTPRPTVGKPVLAEPLDRVVGVPDAEIPPPEDGPVPLEKTPVPETTKKK